MSKNKGNNKPTVATLSDRNGSQVQKNKSSKNKGSALNNISNATHVMNNKKVPSTKKARSKIQKSVSKGQSSSTTTTTDRQKAPPTSTRVSKLLAESAATLSSTATLPSAVTFKCFTCTPTPVKPRTPLSQLTGNVTIPNYSFHGSSYGSELMFKNSGSCTSSVKDKDTYSLKGSSFGILPHFRGVKRKRRSSKVHTSEDNNYNEESHGNAKAKDNRSPLKQSFLPRSEHVFHTKRMKVYVEEFVPDGNTNVDTNKYIKGSIKEDIKKEIQKHADPIALTPPPSPFLSQQLTFKRHTLEQSSDMQEDPPRGAKPLLRPSSIQTEIYNELEVLEKKEKARLQDLRMSRMIARRENERIEERKRSQEIEAQEKKIEERHKNDELYQTTLALSK
ncbi:hypothetical protein EDC94DRAFT_588125 [Helicostylum pulchrum]|nr:hypothetical protein EDC94DRAFT_588125 [Helicostylum pulchrum]